ncbi:PspA/IM30 family protein [Candidatus Poribacteria bacterium]|nr:PspA/IM30 family protein [Candidatus Poribacteria bacterium]
MGVFERISRIIRSNISELLDRAEDPEKILQQIMDDMQQDLREAKLHVAAAIRDQKKLETKYKENLALVKRCELKAINAVEEGNDVAAKELLRRKRTYEQVAQGYKEQLEEQSKSVQVLRTSLTALEAKIEDAKRRKDLLIARQKRAKAQKAISETISGMSKSNALTALEKMEGRVKEAEVNAEAIAEVEANSIENKFAALEDEDVDDELEKLKAQIARKKN